MKIKCQTPKCPPFRFTWAPEMIQRDPQEWTGGTWIMEEDPLLVCEWRTGSDKNV